MTDEIRNNCYRAYPKFLEGFYRDKDVCLDISGNDSGGSSGTAEIGIRKQGPNAAFNGFGIEDLGSGAYAIVVTFTSGLNPLSDVAMLIAMPLQVVF